MTGIELITAERARQVSSEGWTDQHDDEHTLGELTLAAVCYADIEIQQAQSEHENIKITTTKHYWPWGTAHWKPSTEPVRNLVKAGALIAAEIDRIQRATIPPAVSVTEAETANNKGEGKDVKRTDT